MVSIERFEDILDELAEELPSEFYEGLNGGIFVQPERKLHPADPDGRLCIMGEYHNESIMGRYIVLFYGSFAQIFGKLSEDALKTEMRKVFRHEFRHHIEGRAGVRDLEIWDERQLESYKAAFHGKESIKNPRSLLDKLTQKARYLIKNKFDFAI